MKKILLLMALVSYTFMNAQDTCATAVTIGAGTQTVTAINGTPPTLFCAANGDFNPTDNPDSPAGEWYLYTATIDGVATVTTDLTANTGGDTRFHIYTGTCGALVCAGGADDVSSSNYLGTYTFAVVTGDTFYVVFDNRWSSAGFDFEVTETAIPCVIPTNLAARVTESSATLMWTSNDNETLWNIEYGVVGFTQGALTATMVTGHTSTSYDLTGLPALTAYDFYVQADCGAIDGLSSWQGPFTFKTIATPVDCGLVIPSNNFENGITCKGNMHQANDLVVPMGSDLNLTQITPSIMVKNTDNIVSINVKVYLDNNGAPGAILSAQDNVVPTSTTVTGTAFTSYNVTNAVLDLAPVNLYGSTSSDTRYWIGINVKTLVVPANSVFWETTSASVVGLPVAGSDDGTAGSFTSNDNECVYTFVGTCSVAASVNDDLLSSKVSIYPTSTKDVFTINNESNIALTSVSLFDINGRVVLTHSLDNLIGEKTINVSNLSSGMYFVEIKSVDAKMTKKLIKK